MEPHYNPGELIQCDHDLPRENSPAVVRLNDGRLFVGRWERVEKAFRLSFDNPEYQAIELPIREIAYVARVAMMIRDEELE